MGQSSRARQDIVEILKWKAKDDPSAARDLARRIDEATDLLATNKHMGRARPDLGEGLRSFVVSPYTIVYQPNENGVQVIRVLHSSRDVTALL